MKIDGAKRISLENQVRDYLASETNWRGAIDSKRLAVIARTTPYPEMAKDIIDFIEKELDYL